MEATCCCTRLFHAPEVHKCAQTKPGARAVAKARAVAARQGCGSPWVAGRQAGAERVRPKGGAALSILAAWSP